MVRKAVDREALPVGEFSIRVVANRTSLSVETLRMWERRYGFPKPARRPGGSRLYSESDVRRLSLLAAAVRAGYRPGDVIALDDADIQRLISPIAVPRPTSETADKHAVQELVEAFHGDKIEHARNLLRIAASTRGPRHFVTDIAHPLAVAIGDAWARGEVQVRHEHVMTALLTTQLRLLLESLDSGRDTDRPRVVLATLPNEHHALGLEMIAVVLADAGGTPILLGVDTPPEQIVSCACAAKADVIGLSISASADTEASAKGVRKIEKLAPPPLRLWLGGAGASLVRTAGKHAIVGKWSDLDAAIEASRAS